MIYKFISAICFAMYYAFGWTFTKVALWMEPFLKRVIAKVKDLEL